MPIGLFRSRIKRIQSQVYRSMDGSKDDSAVAAAAAFVSAALVKMLPNRFSIFVLSAEVRAVSLALDEIEQATHDQFLIISDFLSTVAFDATSSVQKLSVCCTASSVPSRKLVIVLLPT
jgi:hypothetical protein